MAGITVLIGFAEALSAPEVAWSLIDSGYDVVAFTRKGRRAALQHSRHVTTREITAPESNVEASIADLRQLLETFSTHDGTKRHVLFPLDDTAVWLCDRLSLPGSWVLAGPSGLAAEFALDKTLQLEAARAASFHVPPTHMAKTAQDVFNSADRFPVTLRPSRAVAPQADRLRRGSNWICNNRQELKNAIAQWQENYPLLVQPFIAGCGEGVFGIAGKDGVKALTAHRRLRMMNPHGSGSSACTSQSVPADVGASVENLIKSIGWRGLFMVELLRDRTGTRWFIEFNGRPWGSMALARRQGFEYPSWAIEMALDSAWQLRDKPVARSGVICRNFGRDLMHLLFVLRGPRSKAMTEWPSFGKSAAAVFRLNSTDTFYNWRKDDRKVFWVDCYYTVCGQIFKRKG
ncbi:MAG TPA: hypothetical protein VGM62_07840 [Chthoniobacterales bacterium]